MTDFSREDKDMNFQAKSDFSNVSNKLNLKKNAMWIKKNMCTD